MQLTQPRAPLRGSPLVAHPRGVSRFPWRSRRHIGTTQQCSTVCRFVGTSPMISVMCHHGKVEVRAAMEVQTTRRLDEPLEDYSSLSAQ